MGAARAAVWAAALLLAAVRVRSACLTAADLAVRCASVLSISTGTASYPLAGGSFRQRSARCAHTSTDGLCRSQWA